MSGGGPGDTPKSGLSLVNWVSTPLRSAARSLSWIAGRGSEARGEGSELTGNAPELSGDAGTPAEEAVLDGDEQQCAEATVQADGSVEKKDDLNSGERKEEAGDDHDPDATEARRQEELRNVSTTGKTPGGLAAYDTAGTVEKMRQVRKRRTARKSGRKNGVNKGAAGGGATTPESKTPGKAQQGQGKVEHAEQPAEDCASQKTPVEIHAGESPASGNAVTDAKPENDAVRENGVVAHDAMEHDAADPHVTPPPNCRKRASSEVIDGDRPKKRMLPLFGMSLGKSFKLGRSVQKTTEAKPLRSGSLVERLLGASPLWGKTNPGNEALGLEPPQPSPPQNDLKVPGSEPPKSTATPRTPTYRLLASGGGGQDSSGDNAPEEN